MGLPTNKHGYIYTRLDVVDRRRLVPVVDAIAISSLSWSCGPRSCRKAYVVPSLSDFGCRIHSYHYCMLVP